MKRRNTGSSKGGGANYKTPKFNENIDSNSSHRRQKAMAMTMTSAQKLNVSPQSSNANITLSFEEHDLGEKINTMAESP